jgi:hypothetical protein
MVREDWDGGVDLGVICVEWYGKIWIKYVVFL